METRDVIIDVSDRTVWPEIDDRDSPTEVPPEYWEANVLSKEPDLIMDRHRYYRRHDLLVVTKDRDRVVKALEERGLRPSVDSSLEIGVCKLTVPDLEVLEAIDVLQKNPETSDAIVHPNHILTGVGQGHGPATWPLAVDRPPDLPEMAPGGDGGVVVGVLDTGIVAPDGNVANDFIRPRCRPLSKEDDCEQLEQGALAYESGHGTFVAGIVLQLAPDAEVVSVRTLSSKGFADDWEVARGILRLKESGAKIINLSLGGHTRGDVAPPALEAALNALPPDVVVVAAAGPVHGPLGRLPFWPAMMERVIGVGALMYEDNAPARLRREPQPRLVRSRYSSSGPWVNVWAVGDWISTYVEAPEGQYSLPEYPGRNVDRPLRGWARWSGTSFAAATVSGAIASVMASRKVDANEAARLVTTAAVPVPEIRTKRDVEREVEVRPVPSGASHGSSSIDPDSRQGRFGRMFPHAPVFLPRAEELVQLAEHMIRLSAGAGDARSPGEGDARENPSIPAGYTYLGQFIDHDLTFDPVSSLQRPNDPYALYSFRTPRLDLDSIYGRGPLDQPYLYDDGGKFLLGADVDPGNPGAGIGGPDLPRNLSREHRNGRALIGDPRNDENLIISQLHVLFLKFHNRMIDFVREQTPLRDGDLFKEAQRLVRWHYQWAIVHDFLPRFVGSAAVGDILASETFIVNGKNGPEEVEIARPRPRFYRHPDRPPFIPVEFSAAAYRFGHSTVRSSYLINDVVPEIAILQPASTDENELMNLNGFRRLPDQWGVQWKYFFDLGGRQGDLPQRSHRINASLVHPLGALPSGAPGDPGSLAERNLRRGLSLNLPSGQAVAMAMGIPPLSREDLDLDDFSEDLRSHTPLWYYILREAEVQGDGRQLGSVGGRIVAEVLIGLLAADPLSYLNAGPGWRPERALRNEDGDFTMPELIRFALS